MILTRIIIMSTTRILTIVYNKEYCVYTYTLYTFLQWTCVNKANSMIWGLCKDWACSQKNSILIIEVVFRHFLHNLHAEGTDINRPISVESRTAVAAPRTSMKTNNLDWEHAQHDLSYLVMSLKIIHGHVRSE